MTWTPRDISEQTVGSARASIPPLLLIDYCSVAVRYAGAADGLTWPKTASGSHGNDERAGRVLAGRTWILEPRRAA